MYFMVFDVESIGLHGEGFAVGFTVIDEIGIELDFGLFSCEQSKAKGDRESRKWCYDNIPHFGTTHNSPKEVRDEFWKKWTDIKAKFKNVLLVTDCGWPVEANFLSACVNDDLDSREHTGPYPLIDVGSVIYSKLGNPLYKYSRLLEEMPEHNPYCDAKQSARIFIEYLKR